MYGITLTTLTLTLLTLTSRLKVSQDLYIPLMCVLPRLISASFQLSHPFPSPLPPSIVAMCIDLFVLQWSSVTSQ